MSKLVKGIGRAVKKVVGGIVKVVKKVVSSPIGRMIAIAAGSFFLGPMAAGFAQGWGAAGAAGGGFMSQLGAGLAGAGQGFMGAAANLGSAAGALFTDGFGAAKAALNAPINVTAGGADLASSTAGELGFSGSGLVNSNMAGAMGDVGVSSMIGSQGADTFADTGYSLAGGTNPSMSPYASSAESSWPVGVGGESTSLSLGEGLKRATGSGTGIVETILNGIKEYKLGPSLVQTGGKMLAGAMQGKAAEDQRKRDLQRMYDNYKIDWGVGPDGRYYAR